MKLLVLCGAAIMAISLNAPAAMTQYTPVNNGLSSTAIGNSSLSLSGEINGRINFNFTSGGGVNQFLVFYLDSTSGGVSGTGGFQASGQGAVSAISGFDGTHRATSTFASGFGADYALVLNADLGVVLYRVADGNITLQRGVLPAPGGGIVNVQFSLSRADLGMGGGDRLSFQSAYMTGTGYRSTMDSFESLSGSVGFTPATYGFFNVFDVQPVPEMTDVALVVFGGLAVTGSVGVRLRRYLRRRKISAS